MFSRPLCPALVKGCQRTDWNCRQLAMHNPRTNGLNFNYNKSGSLYSSNNNNFPSKHKSITNKLLLYI